MATQIDYGRFTFYVQFHNTSAIVITMRDNDTNAVYNAFVDETNCGQLRKSTFIESVFDIHVNLEYRYSGGRAFASPASIAVAFNARDKNDVHFITTRIVAGLNTLYWA